METDLISFKDHYFANEVVTTNVIPYLSATDLRAFLFAYPQTFANLKHPDAFNALFRERSIQLISSTDRLQQLIDFFHGLTNPSDIFDKATFSTGWPHLSRPTIERAISRKDSSDLSDALHRYGGKPTPEHLLQALQAEWKIAIHSLLQLEVAADPEWLLELSPNAAKLLILALPPTFSSPVFSDLSAELQELVGVHTELCRAIEEEDFATLNPAIFKPLPPPGTLRAPPAFLYDVLGPGLLHHAFNQDKPSPQVIQWLLTSMNINVSPLTLQRACELKRHDLAILHAETNNDLSTLDQVLTCWPTDVRIVDLERMHAISKLNSAERFGLFSRESSFPGAYDILVELPGLGEDDLKRLLPCIARGDIKFAEKQKSHLKDSMQSDEFSQRLFVWATQWAPDRAQLINLFPLSDKARILALGSAILRGKLELSKALVSKLKAKGHPLPDRCVRLAASTSGPKAIAIARYLIDQGADIEAMREAATNNRDPRMREFLRDLPNTDQTTLHVELASLVERRSLEELDMLLIQMKEYDLLDEEGLSLLHRSVLNGWYEGMSLLCSWGANLDVPTATGETPLILAAKNDLYSIAVDLIRLGADFDKADIKGKTPLHHAAAMGHDDIVGLLIQELADLNAQDATGKPPLLHALLNGHPATVCLLTEAGAMLDIRDNEGNTPLGQAVEDEKTEMIELLCAHGASPSYPYRESSFSSTPYQTPECPFERAAQKGYLEGLRIMGTYALLKPTYMGGRGILPSNAFPWAVLGGSIDAFKALAELFNSFKRYGQSVLEGHTYSSVGEQCLSILGLAALQGDVSMIEYLISIGAVLSPRAHYMGPGPSSSPIHLAAAHNHLDALKSLITHGVRREEHDRRGRTPLHRAILGGAVETARWLVENGSATDVTDSEGQTLMGAAATHSDEAISGALTELLLSTIGT